MKMLLQFKPQNDEPKLYTFSERTILSENFFLKSLKCEEDELKIFSIACNYIVDDITCYTVQVEEPVIVFAVFPDETIDSARSSSGVLLPKNELFSEIFCAPVYGEAFILDKRLLCASLRIKTILDAKS